MNSSIASSVGPLLGSLAAAVGLMLWRQRLPAAILRQRRNQSTRITTAQSKAGEESLIPSSTNLSWDARSHSSFGEASYISDSPISDSPKVSIIVAARNEALNLPVLLASLTDLNYRGAEVIVVDDQSTDDTNAVAQSFKPAFARAMKTLQVIPGKQRPSGWMGKQWACAQGAEVATGELLLFTDADTVHAPNGLQTVVAELLRRRCAMVSVPPYHQTNKLWEEPLGLFHLILLAIGRPFKDPKLGQLYAIGQYILFDRAAYEELGGHSLISGAIAEDLALANACLSRHLNYQLVWPTTAVYEVRMYDDFVSFCRGWRRNFRAGFAATSPVAAMFVTPLLVVAVISLGSGLYYALQSLTMHQARIDDSLVFGREYVGLGLAGLMTFVVGLSTVCHLAKWQGQIGSFKVRGVIAWPLTLLLFIVVTSLALWDQLTGQSLHWKGRAYERI